MQEDLSTDSHPSLRLIPRTLSLSAPSDSARWPSILFLSEKVFRRESEEAFGVIWNIIHCLPSECIMLVSTPLPRALMMSGLDSGKGDLMYLLISHPCNSSSTSTQQPGMILNTKCGCDHVLPITESLTALQGLREMLQTLSAGSCPALSVPPAHPPTTATSTRCFFNPQHLAFSAENPPFLCSSLPGPHVPLPQRFAHLVDMFLSSETSFYITSPIKSFSTPHVS